MNKLKLKNIFILIFLMLAVILLPSCQRNSSESDTRFLLDTVCTVTAGTTSALNTNETQKQIIDLAFSVVEDIEKNISYYDENSTVSKFNSAPKNTEIELDDDTFMIVKTALFVYEKTNGAFDITIAPVSELWDFKSENPLLPNQDAIENALKSVGSDKLVLNTENKTLSKTEDGVKIDLGGCGKGYAVNKAAKTIKESFKDFYAILDFGGNICAVGSNPKYKDGHFSVGIQAPFEESGKYNQTETVYDGDNIVTSGTYQRHFYIDSKNYHHIIDPKTGYPSESGISSATIISNDGLMCDCLSTASIVLGEEKAGEITNEMGVKAIFLK